MCPRHVAQEAERDSLAATLADRNRTIDQLTRDAEAERERVRATAAAQISSAALAAEGARAEAASRSAEQGAKHQVCARGHNNNRVGP